MLCSIGAKMKGKPAAGILGKLSRRPGRLREGSQKGDRLVNGYLRPDKLGEPFE